MTETFVGVEVNDSPSEAVFAALGNETRLQVLYALFEAADPLADDVVLSFSDLFDRVEYDTPANFSYHVDKLVDAGFVREAEAGYTLATPGEMIVRTIAAGWATNDPAVEPAPIDIECPQCGTQASLSYTSGVMRAHCPHCSEIELAPGAYGEAFNLMCLGLPPTGLVDRRPAEIFRAALAYQSRRMQTHLDGVCPSCTSRVTPTIDICEDHDPSEDSCEACGRDPQARVRAVCENCHSYATLRVSRAMQTRPAVTAFYHDHGIDHQFASWAAVRRSRAYPESVVSEDPVRIRVTVSCEDEHLHLTIDEELTVVDETRERVAPA